MVLRALGLGDALTGVAALRGVRRAWPDHRLVLAGPATSGGWLRELRLVDAVLPTDGLVAVPWHGELDVAVNLHGRGPESHRIVQALTPRVLVAFANPDAGHDGPAWTAEEHEVDRWCRLVGTAGGRCGREDLLLESDVARGARVVVHPGAASPSRRWPAERWREVVATLVDRGSDVVVTGSEEEHALCTEVAGEGGEDLAGRLDLPALARVVQQAGLLLSGDTGVAHLATAYRTPSVLLFGPTPPGRWGPAVDLDLHTVLWKGCGVGDPHGRDIDPALAGITVDEVLEAARALIDGASPSDGSAYSPVTPSSRSRRRSA